MVHMRSVSKLTLKLCYFSFKLFNSQYVGVFASSRILIHANCVVPVAPLARLFPVTPYFRRATRDACIDSATFPWTLLGCDSIHNDRQLQDR